MQPHGLVTRLCRQVGMTRQNYYKGSKQRQKRALAEAPILEFVLSLRRLHPRMGTEKLLREWKNQPGELPPIGRDRLYELLRRHSLLLKPLKGAPKTTHSLHTLKTYTNALAKASLSGPHQAWVSDITYLRLQGGRHLYLFLTMDAWSRQIVGWKLSENFSAATVIQCLKKALRQLPRGHTPVHHSDRGSQYCSHDFIGELLKKRLTPSMTEQNHCYENAKAERLNGILKQEYMLGEIMPDLATANLLVEQAISLYNNHRPHRALGLKKPAQVHQTKVA